MKKMNISKPLMILCLFFSLIMTGCYSTSLTSEISPGKNLSNYKKFYVPESKIVRQGSERGETHILIAEALKKMGLQAEYGLEADMPEDTDIIVAFQDKWFRDITLYLLDLKIIFMEPESKTIVAKGQSYRTSLARKSPEQMVKEVLDSIFAQKG